MAGLEQVLANLGRWHQEKRAAIQAIAASIAKQAEAKAKIDRPWKDRTANARQGLKGGVAWQDIVLLIIYLAHSVDYGPYLELAHDGKYQIIEKTLNSYRTELYNSLKRIMNA